MSSFVVRPAERRDVEVLIQIHAQAQGEQRDAASAVTQGPSYWRDAIEYGEPQVLVACDGEKLVGFIGFDRSRDKRTPPTMGEIWYVFAMPPYWGQGVGLALWDAARDALVDEGCTDVSIWIELAQERALRFHELAGFKRDMASLRTVPKGTIRVEEVRLKRKL